MILPIIAREAERAQREVERFSAWTSAFRNFSQDWRNGIRVPPLALTVYLSAVPKEQRDAALEDLVAEHLRLSWDSSPLAPLLREYGARFSDADAPAALVEEEFLARSTCRWNQPPALEEYLARFECRPEVTGRLRQRGFSNGRLIRLRRLGRGASGEVWEAYDREHGRAVALKIPRRGREHDPGVREQFLLEAQLTARLDHPAIVRIHEASGPCDPVPFLIYQLSRNPALSDLVRDLHPASAAPPGGWPPFLRCLEKICGAVEHAHSRGLIHRDLKPGNVLAGMDETLVIDWSLARAPGTRECSGTPEYMPPERLDSPAGERDDVYGLGAILYESLTGRPPCPWEGPRPADWPVRIRRDAVPAPRKIRPSIPRVLEALCLRALSRDPAGRPASVLAFRQELGRALETLAAPSWGRRLWRWLSRPHARSVPSTPCPS